MASRTIDNELPKGAVAMRNVIRALEHPDRLEDSYARAVLLVARNRAGQRPTPQAPIVAAALQVDHGSIVAPSGSAVGHNAAPLAELLWGAERGSTIYRQFGARSSRGYWLAPATDDRRALEPAERTLADLVAEVARRA